MTLPGLSLDGLDDLLELLEQDISVVLLEDQHGPQADSAGATATDVDTERTWPWQGTGHAWGCPRR